MVVHSGKRHGRVDVEAVTESIHQGVHHHPVDGNINGKFGGRRHFHLKAAGCGVALGVGGGFPNRDHGRRAKLRQDQCTLAVFSQRINISRRNLIGQRTDFLFDLSSGQHQTAFTFGLGFHHNADPTSELRVEQISATHADKQQTGGDQTRREETHGPSQGHEINVGLQRFAQRRHCNGQHGQPLRAHDVGVEQEALSSDEQG